jgi:hypothetical protein
MSPLTVMLDLGDPAAAERHRVALATLPARLRIATEPGADAVAVSGRDPDWPASAVAAISSGARGVLVARPSPADVDAVRQLQETASGTGAVVAVEVPSSTRRGSPPSRACAQPCPRRHWWTGCSSPVTASHPGSWST